MRLVTTFSDNTQQTFAWQNVRLEENSPERTLPLGPARSSKRESTPTAWSIPSGSLIKLRPTVIPRIAQTTRRIAAMFESPSPTMCMKLLAPVFSIFSCIGRTSAASSGSLRDATRISNTATPDGREKTSHSNAGQSDTRAPTWRCFIRSRNRRVS